ncbi:MAG: BatA and WFA domain-containing protein, partial [Fimbriimonadales bacterium]
MQFQSLGVLLWLVPVAGFIILLYLLKVRRREVRVPARFLFPPITTDVRANALIQKLRPNLLMFLQILLALLALLALARPMMLAKGLPGQSVVVIDTSASMGAQEGTTTRFEQARAELRTLIRDLNPSEQMAIVEAGTQVRVVAPLTNDKQKLLRAVENLRVSQTANTLDEALRLASALVGKSEQGRIVLMSDGAFPPVSDFSAGTAKLQFRSFGSNRENLAIVAMDVQETARGWEWFVNLRNFGTQDAKTVLEFYAGGKLVDAREVRVPAGQSTGQTLTLAQIAEPLEVRMDADDALDADNRAYRVGATQRPKRVLIV